MQNELQLPEKQVRKKGFGKCRRGKRKKEIKIAAFFFFS